MSPESADDVFNAEGVSGALVGGASLNANKFAAIVAAWERRLNGNYITKHTRFIRGRRYWAGSYPTR